MLKKRSITYWGKEILSGEINLKEEDFLPQRTQRKIQRKVTQRSLCESLRNSLAIFAVYINHPQYYLNRSLTTRSFDPGV